MCSSAGRRWRGVISGAQAASVSVRPWMTDGSLAPFPERLYQGVSVNTITGAKHTDVRITRPPVKRSGSRLKAAGAQAKPSAYTQLIPIRSFRPASEAETSLMALAIFGAAADDLV